MGIKSEEGQQIVAKIDKPTAGQRFSKEERKFVQNLIRERKRLRITQESLAKMTGVDQAAIGRLESMRVTPTLKTMIKILNALDKQLIIADKE